MYLMIIKTQFFVISQLLSLKFSVAWRGVGVSLYSPESALMGKYCWVWVGIVHIWRSLWLFTRRILMVLYPKYSVGFPLVPLGMKISLPRHFGLWRGPIYNILVCDPSKYFVENMKLKFALNMFLLTDMKRLFVLSLDYWDNISSLRYPPKVFKGESSRSITSWYLVMRLNRVCLCWSCHLRTFSLVLEDFYLDMVVVSHILASYILLIVSTFMCHISYVLVG